MTAVGNVVTGSAMHWVGPDASGKVLTMVLLFDLEANAKYDVQFWLGTQWVTVQTVVTASSTPQPFSTSVQVSAQGVPVRLVRTA